MNIVPSNSIIGLVSFSKKSEVASTQSIVPSLVAEDKETKATGCRGLTCAIDGRTKRAGTLPDSGSAIGVGGNARLAFPPHI